MQPIWPELTIFQKWLAMIASSSSLPDKLIMMLPCIANVMQHGTKQRAVKTHVYMTGQCELLVASTQHMWAAANAIKGERRGNQIINELNEEYVKTRASLNATHKKNLNAPV